MDWLQILIPTIISSVFAGALATWLRMRPRMKEVELQGEQALWTEIASLRSDLKRERELCDERITRIEERHATEMATVNAEVQVLRHDRNNVRQALNAMFAMLKQEGADVVRVVAAIEDMLKQGDEVIAVEKAAIPMIKGGARK